MKQLGLIGRPLGHSLSQEYFHQKFQDLGLEDYEYQLYELQHIEELDGLIADVPLLIGLNVTIPFKRSVIPYLSSLSNEAKRIKAVNTIKISPYGELVGHNTDYFGFLKSLTAWMDDYTPEKALVLGTGGASAAVSAVLEDLKIASQTVSRNSSPSSISYEQLRQDFDLHDYPLIINTTPLGMFPKSKSIPDINFARIDNRHYLYDLVYNPEQTAFMKQGQKQGAKVKNGLEMLHLQAEKAWEIWTG